MKRSPAPRQTALPLDATRFCSDPERASQPPCDDRPHQPEIRPSIDCSIYQKHSELPHARQPRSASPQRRPADRSTRTRGSEEQSRAAELTETGLDPRHHGTARGRLQLLDRHLSVFASRLCISPCPSPRTRPAQSVTTGSVAKRRIALAPLGRPTLAVDAIPSTPRHSLCV